MWNTRDQLVADLQAFDWRKEVGQTKKFASQEWEQVIRRAVASNTFRAFHRMPERPSRGVSGLGVRCICQSRAYSNPEHYFQRFRLRHVAHETRRGFPKLLAIAHGREFQWSPLTNLPNLLLKCVALRPEIPALQQQRLVNWLHIPLDSYTVQGLRGWFRLPGGSAIPSGATMKFVRDANLYDSLQCEIKRIATLAGVPPIAFDYLAWNAGHRKTST